MQNFDAILVRCDPGYKKPTFKEWLAETVHNFSTLSYQEKITRAGSSKTSIKELSRLFWDTDPSIGRAVLKNLERAERWDHIAALWENMGGDVHHPLRSDILVLINKILARNDYAEIEAAGEDLKKEWEKPKE